MWSIPNVTRLLKTSSYSDWRVFRWTLKCPATKHCVILAGSIDHTITLTWHGRRVNFVKTKVFSLKNSRQTNLLRFWLQTGFEAKICAYNYLTKEHVSTNHTKCSSILVGYHSVLFKSITITMYELFIFHKDKQWIEKKIVKFKYAQFFSASIYNIKNNLLTCQNNFRQTCKHVLKWVCVKWIEMRYNLRVRKMYEMHC